MANEELSDIYREFLALEYLDHNDNISLPNMHITEHLSVSGNMNFDSLNVEGNLTISQSSILIQPTDLTISDRTHIHGAMSVNDSIDFSDSNINVADKVTLKTLVNNNIKSDDNLASSSSIDKATNLKTEVIETVANINNGISSSSINIEADTINIGNSNTTVNIYGESKYFIENNADIVDKNIELNIDETSFIDGTISGNDNGGNTGIEILGDVSSGHLKTNNNADGLLLKLPNDVDQQKVLLFDDTDTIRGVNNSTVEGTMVVNKNLFVENKLTADTLTGEGFQVGDNFTVMGNLTVNDNGNITTPLVDIGATTNIGNDLSSNSINTTTLQTEQMMASKLNATVGSVLSNTSSDFKGNLESLNTRAEGNATFGVARNLNLSTLLGNSISNNLNTVNITTMSSVEANELETNNMYVHSNLSVLHDFTANNSFTANSTMSLTNKVIIHDVLDFNNNADAGLQGIGFNQVYRYGGILKVKISTVPPTITLNGLDNIVFIVTPGNEEFKDPGGVVTDEVETENLKLFIISVDNVIKDPKIEVVPDTTVIGEISSLSGQVEIVYEATGSNGLSRTITRTVTIVSTFIPFILDYTFYTYDAMFRAFTTGNPLRYETGIGNATIFTTYIDSDVRTGNRFRLIKFLQDFDKQPFSIRPEEFIRFSFVPSYSITGTKDFATNSWFAALKIKGVNPGWFSITSNVLKEVIESTNVDGTDPGLDENYIFSTTADISKVLTTVEFQPDFIVYVRGDNTRSAAAPTQLHNFTGSNVDQVTYHDGLIDNSIRLTNWDFIINGFFLTVFYNSVDKLTTYKVYNSAGDVLLNIVVASRLDTPVSNIPFKFSINDKSPPNDKNDLKIMDGYYLTEASTEIDFNVFTLEFNSGNNFDYQAPEITLIGDSEIPVVLGKSFVDPGVTAIDTNDGIIPVYIYSINDAVLPTKILVENDTTVILSIATFPADVVVTIVYEAVDQANNRSTITRSLNIIRIYHPYKFNIDYYDNYNQVTKRFEPDSIHPIDYDDWDNEESTIYFTYVPTVVNTTGEYRAMDVPDFYPNTTSWKYTHNIGSNWMISKNVSKKFNFRANWFCVLKLRKIEGEGTRNGLEIISNIRKNTINMKINNSVDIPTINNSRPSHFISGSTTSFIKASSGTNLFINNAENTSTYMATNQVLDMNGRIEYSFSPIVESKGYFLTMEKVQDKIIYRTYDYTGEKMSDMEAPYIDIMAEDIPFLVYGSNGSTDYIDYAYHDGFILSPHSLEFADFIELFPSKLSFEFNVVELTLIGDENYEIIQGSVYVDPGVTAFDTIDDNLDVYVYSIDDVVQEPRIKIISNFTRIPNVLTTADKVITIVYEASALTNTSRNTITRTVTVANIFHSYKYDDSNYDESLKIILPNTIRPSDFQGNHPINYDDWDNKESSIYFTYIPTVILGTEDPKVTNKPNFYPDSSTWRYTHYLMSNWLPSKFATRNIDFSDDWFCVLKLRQYGDKQDQFGIILNSNLDSYKMDESTNEVIIYQSSSLSSYIGFSSTFVFINVEDSGDVSFNTSNNTSIYRDENPIISSNAGRTSLLLNFDPFVKANGYFISLECSPNKTIFRIHDFNGDQMFEVLTTNTNSNVPNTPFYVNGASNSFEYAEKEYHEGFVLSQAPLEFSEVIDLFPLGLSFNTGPVLTLIGDDEYTFIGNMYIEPGVSASDSSLVYIYAINGRKLETRILVEEGITQVSDVSFLKGERTSIMYESISGNGGRSTIVRNIIGSYQVFYSYTYDVSNYDEVAKALKPTTLRPRDGPSGNHPISYDDWDNEESNIYFTYIATSELEGENPISTDIPDYYYSDAKTWKYKNNIGSNWMPSKNATKDIDFRQNWFSVLKLRRYDINYTFAIRFNLRNVSYEMNPTTNNIEQSFRDGSFPYFLINNNRMHFFSSPNASYTYTFQGADSSYVDTSPDINADRIVIHKSTESIELGGYFLSMEGSPGRIIFRLYDEFGKKVFDTTVPYTSPSRNIPYFVNASINNVNHSDYNYYDGFVLSELPMEFDEFVELFPSKLSFNTGPELTLVGGDNYTFTKDVYVDPGVTASDGSIVYIYSVNDIIESTEIPIQNDTTEISNVLVTNGAVSTIKYVVDNGNGARSTITRTVTREQKVFHPYKYDVSNYQKNIKTIRPATIRPADANGIHPISYDDWDNEESSIYFTYVPTGSISDELNIATGLPEFYPNSTTWKYANEFNFGSNWMPSKNITKNIDFTGSYFCVFKLRQFGEEFYFAIRSNIDKSSFEMDESVDNNVNENFSSGEPFFYIHQNRVYIQNDNSIAFRFTLLDVTSPFRDETPNVSSNQIQFNHNKELYTNGYFLSLQASPGEIIYRMYDSNGLKVLDAATQYSTTILRNIPPLIHPSRTVTERSDYNYYDGFILKEGLPMKFDEFVELFPSKLSFNIGPELVLIGEKDYYFAESTVFVDPGVTTVNSNIDIYVYAINDVKLDPKILLIENTTTIPNISSTNGTTSTITYEFNDNNGTKSTITRTVTAIQVFYPYIYDETFAEGYSQEDKMFKPDTVKPNFNGIHPITYDDWDNDSTIYLTYVSTDILGENDYRSMDFPDFYPNSSSWRYRYGIGSNWMISKKGLKYIDFTKNWFCVLKLRKIRGSSRNSIGFLSNLTKEMFEMSDINNVKQPVQFNQHPNHYISSVDRSYVTTTDSVSGNNIIFEINTESINYKSENPAFDSVTNKLEYDFNQIAEESGYFLSLEGSPGQIIYRTYDFDGKKMSDIKVPYDVDSVGEKDVPFFVHASNGENDHSDYEYHDGYILSPIPLEPEKFIDLFPTKISFNLSGPTLTLNQGDNYEFGSSLLYVDPGVASSDGRDVHIYSINGVKLDTPLLLDGTNTTVENVSTMENDVTVIRYETIDPSNNRVTITRTVIGKYKIFHPYTYDMTGYSMLLKTFNPSTMKDNGGIHPISYDDWDNENSSVYFTYIPTEDKGIENFKSMDYPDFYSDSSSWQYKYRFGSNWMISKNVAKDFNFRDNWFFVLKLRQFNNKKNAFEVRLNVDESIYQLDNATLTIADVDSVLNYPILSIKDNVITVTSNISDPFIVDESSNTSPYKISNPTFDGSTVSFKSSQYIEENGYFLSLEGSVDKIIYRMYDFNGDKMLDLSVVYDSTAANIVPLYIITSRGINETVNYVFHDGYVLSPVPVEASKFIDLFTTKLSFDIGTSLMLNGRNEIEFGKSMYVDPGVVASDGSEVYVYSVNGVVLNPKILITGNTTEIDDVGTVEGDVSLVRYECFKSDGSRSTITRTVTGTLKTFYEFTFNLDYGDGYDDADKMFKPSTMKADGGIHPIDYDDWDNDSSIYITYTPTDFIGDNPDPKNMDLPIFYPESKSWRFKHRSRSNWLPSKLVTQNFNFKQDNFSVLKLRNLPNTTTQDYTNIRQNIYRELYQMDETTGIVRIPFSILPPKTETQRPFHLIRRNKSVFAIDTRENYSVDESENTSPYKYNRIPTTFKVEVRYSIPSTVLENGIFLSIEWLGDNCTYRMYDFNGEKILEITGTSVNSREDVPFLMMVTDVVGRMSDNVYYDGFVISPVPLEPSEFINMFPSKYNFDLGEITLTLLGNENDTFGDISSIYTDPGVTTSNGDVHVVAINGLLLDTPILVTGSTQVPNVSYAEGLETIITYRGTDIDGNRSTITRTVTGTTKVFYPYTYDVSNYDTIAKAIVPTTLRPRDGPSGNHPISYDDWDNEESSIYFTYVPTSELEGENPISTDIPNFYLNSRSWTYESNFGSSWMPSKNVTKNIDFSQNWFSVLKMGQNGGKNRAFDIVFNLEKVSYEMDETTNNVVNPRSNNNRPFFDISNGLLFFISDNKEGIFTLDGVTSPYAKTPFVFWNGARMSFDNLMLEKGFFLSMEGSPGQIIFKIYDDNGLKVLDITLPYTESLTRNVPFLVDAARSKTRNDVFIFYDGLVLSENPLEFDEFVELFPSKLSFNTGPVLTLVETTGNDNFENNILYIDPGVTASDGSVVNIYAINDIKLDTPIPITGDRTEVPNISIIKDKVSIIKYETIDTNGGRSTIERTVTGVLEVYHSYKYDLTQYDGYDINSRMFKPIDRKRDSVTGIHPINYDDWDNEESSIYFTYIPTDVRGSISQLAMDVPNFYEGKTTWKYTHSMGSNWMISKNAAKNVDFSGNWFCVLKLRLLGNGSYYFVFRSNLEEDNYQMNETTQRIEKANQGIQKFPIFFFRNKLITIRTDLSSTSDNFIFKSLGINFPHDANIDSFNINNTSATYNSDRFVEENGYFLSMEGSPNKIIYRMYDFNGDKMFDLEANYTNPPKDIPFMVIQSQDVTENIFYEYHEGFILSPVPLDPPTFINLFPQKTNFDTSLTVLTLNGDSNYTLIGTTYIDPGVTASDGSVVNVYALNMKKLDTPINIVGTNTVIPGVSIGKGRITVIRYESISSNGGRSRITRTVTGSSLFYPYTYDVSNYDTIAKAIVPTTLRPRDGPSGHHPISYDDWDNEESSIYFTYLPTGYINDELNISTGLPKFYPNSTTWKYDDGFNFGSNWMPSKAATKTIDFTGNYFCVFKLRQRDEEFYFAIRSNIDKSSFEMDESVDNNVNENFSSGEPFFYIHQNRVYIRNDNSITPSFTLSGVTSPFRDETPNVTSNQIRFDHSQALYTNGYFISLEGSPGQIIYRMYDSNGLKVLDATLPYSTTGVRNIPPFIHPSTRVGDISDYEYYDGFVLSETPMTPSQFIDLFPSKIFFNTGPVLTLLGDPLIRFIPPIFRDPGITASDGSPVRTYSLNDAKVSSPITISGTNTEITGTFGGNRFITRIKYESIAANGGRSTITRTVMRSVTDASFFPYIFDRYQNGVYSSGYRRFRTGHPISFNTWSDNNNPSTIYSTYVPDDHLNGRSNLTMDNPQFINNGTTWRWRHRMGSGWMLADSMTRRFSSTNRRRNYIFKLQRDPNRDIGSFDLCIGFLSNLWHGHYYLSSSTDTLQDPNGGGQRPKFNIRYGTSPSSLSVSTNPAVVTNNVSGITSPDRITNFNIRNNLAEFELNSSLQDEGYFLSIETDGSSISYRIHDWSGKKVADMSTNHGLDDSKPFLIDTMMMQNTFTGYIFHEGFISTTGVIQDHDIVPLFPNGSAFYSDWTRTNFIVEP